MWIVILACLLIPGNVVVHAQNQVHSPYGHLIEFELKDQFGDTHVRAELSGFVTVLIASDKDGSKYNEEWAEAIAKRVSMLDHASTIRLLGLGDVQGVPFFLKGYVRGRFPKNKEEPVLLDWDGLFAKTYAFVENKTNIVIFNSDFTTRLQTSVTAMDSTKLEFIMDAIQASINR